MGEFESVGEILEFAIAREEEANRLYMDLAVRAGNPAMRRVFEDFAEVELEHKAKLELEAMKEGIVVTPRERLAAFRIADYVADAESVPEMDYKDVLMFAIKKERISVRLYVDLAAIIEDAGAREMLLSLAEEEAGHKARFEIEYENAVLRGS
ncbi:MAG: ferritin family protein [Planctomycetota bacterium]|nr:MAG: ferritin family protein [Planctomycetota bacterium]